MKNQPYSSELISTGAVTLPDGTLVIASLVHRPGTHTLDQAKSLVSDAKTGRPVALTEEGWAYLDRQLPLLDGAPHP